MAQVWTDHPQPTHFTPLDLAYQHELSMMYGGYNVRGPFFYPQSPYGMGGLGDPAFGQAACAPPFQVQPGPFGSFTCVCPPDMYTVNDPIAGRSCVSSCPPGTIGPGGPGSACVADPNLVPPGMQINLQTGQVSGVGTPGTPTGPSGNLTPSAAPTQAPNSQPGIVPMNALPLNNQIPPLPNGGIPPAPQGMTSDSSSGPNTILGMSPTVLAVVGIGTLLLFTQGGKH